MITEQEHQQIQHQIGRVPRGVVSVAVAKKGIPVVLQMRSLLDNKPFPTLYWLSSKTLHKAIARIETDGWVKKLEQRLISSESLAHEYHRNQQDYIRSRFDKMRPEDQQAIARLGYQSLFSQLGIGGLSDHSTIRCLHMHYAHHLAEANSIGAFMDNMFHLDQLDILE